MQKNEKLWRHMPIYLLSDPLLSSYQFLSSSSNNGQLWYIFLCILFLPFNKIGNNLKFYPLTKALHVKNNIKWCCSMKRVSQNIKLLYLNHWPEWHGDNGYQYCCHRFLQYLNIIHLSSGVSWSRKSETLILVWHKSVWEWMPSWYLQWIQYSETWIFHTSLPYSTI